MTLPPPGPLDFRIPEAKRQLVVLDAQEAVLREELRAIAKERRHLQYVIGAHHEQGESPARTRHAGNGAG